MACSSSVRVLFVVVVLGVAAASAASVVVGGVSIVAAASVASGVSAVSVVVVGASAVSVVASAAAASGVSAASPSDTTPSQHTSAKNEGDLNSDSQFYPSHNHTHHHLLKRQVVRLAALLSQQRGVALHRLHHTETFYNS